MMGEPREYSSLVFPCLRPRESPPMENADKIKPLDPMKKTKSVKIMKSAVAILSLSIAIIQSVAQPAARMLKGHVPEISSSLQPIGVLPVTDTMKLAICLPFRNEEALSNLLQQQSDPSSPNYRRFLTPAEFTELFAPTIQDYQTVIDFAKRQGLAIAATSGNRKILVVTGSVATVQNAFHVTMLVYQHPMEPRTFYAPNVEPSVPSTIPIIDISGFDTYGPPQPGHRSSQLEPLPAAVAASGSGPSGTYIGNDFRNAYAPGVSLNGGGQKVGLLEFGGYYANDIRTYETQAGLPNVPVRNVLIDGYNGNPGPSGDVIEVSLDIEMAIAMAPGLSQVTVYEADPNTGIPADILNEIAFPTQGEPLPLEVSSSWFWQGPRTGIYTILNEMAAQGQSFLQASGDGDAWCGRIWVPADSDYSTMAGGTSLTMNGSGASYSSETTWNFGYSFPNCWTPNGNCYIGSGGGISDYTGIPTWQQGINMSQNGGSTTFRNIPDVAMVAANVYVVANNNSAYSVAGTSIAAPLWAGFTAMVNQQRATLGKNAIGSLNVPIYAIARSGSYSSCFHDITTGNNINSCSGGHFSAVTGYDLCTGWGSPTGINLINALAAY